MKLLRVGGAHETVSIGGVNLFAFGNSITARNPVRVSCVAALGWSVARETMFCCGELDVLCGELRLVGAIGHASIVIPRPWDCASANGIAQMARSESRIKALRRRCALNGRINLFFHCGALVIFGNFGNNPLRLGVCRHSRASPFTAKRELHQDFFENLMQFFSGAMASMIRPPKKLKLNGTICREISGFIAEAEVFGAKSSAGYRN